MNRVLTWGMAAALAAGLGGGLAAQEGGDPKPEGRKRPAASSGSPLSFAQMDADKDGKISKAEFEAAFAKLDKDSDGFLSQQELGPAPGERKRKEKE